MNAAYMIDEACSCAACEVLAGVQAIKQQSQLGKQEGLGKLYSNLAACYLQQEHYQEAINACQAALQVPSWLRVSHFELQARVLSSTVVTAANPYSWSGRWLACCRCLMPPRHRGPLAHTCMHRSQGVIAMKHP